MNQTARGDEVVTLEPKVMALLVVLANRRDEALSRDDLMAAVWPGVVGGDNALTQVVIKLRKALGDSAREPSYVQAIAKKGYRLVATVRRSDETTGAAPLRHPSEPSPSAPVQATRHASGGWLAGAVFAVGIAAYVSRGRGPGPPSYRATGIPAQYLNNIVEQDHRTIERVVRLMLGFKSFACARILISGIETMHMIRKGQLERLNEQSSSAAHQFYSLAF